MISANLSITSSVSQIAVRNDLIFAVVTLIFWTTRLAPAPILKARVAKSSRDRLQKPSLSSTIDVRNPCFVLQCQEVMNHLKLRHTTYEYTSQLMRYNKFWKQISKYGNTEQKNIIEDVPTHVGPNLVFADDDQQKSRPGRLAKHPAFASQLFDLSG